MTCRRTKPLSELLDTIESGSRPKGGVGEISDGIPSLGGEHITRDGGFSWESPKHVTKDFFNSMKRGRIRPGDILVVKDGATTGKTAIVRESFPFPQAAINEHVFLLRVQRSEVLPEYVGYFLTSPHGQRQILSSYRGSAIGGITQDFSRAVHVPMVPLSEQERIVELLDEASALQKLRAKADRRTADLIPALFQAMFDDGSRFPIKPLSDFVEASRGITYGVVQRGNHHPGGVPLLRIVDFNDNVFRPRDLVCVEPSISEQYSRTILKGGELVVSIRGTVGRIAIIPPEARGWNVAREVAVVPLHPNVCRNYIHAFMLSHKAQSFMTNEIRGIAQRGINLDDLRRLPVPTPPEKLQQEFSDRVCEIHELKAEQSRSSRRLNDLSQSLLHSAFGGV